jgi:hypothetical protein
MVIAEAQRTLVKSPPELWSELSDPAALARHLGELGEIRIVRTSPEQTVEWEAEDKRGRVEIQPSGWGTKVTLSVTIEGSRRPSDDERTSNGAPNVSAGAAPTADSPSGPMPAEPAPRRPSQTSPELEQKTADVPQAEAADAFVADAFAADGEPAEVEAGSAELPKVEAAAAPIRSGEETSEPTASREHERITPAAEGHPPRGLLWRLRRLGRALRRDASAEKVDESTDQSPGVERALGAPQTAAAVAEPRSAGTPEGGRSAGTHSVLASRATSAVPDASASRATERDSQSSADQVLLRAKGESRENENVTGPSPTPAANQDNPIADTPWSRAREEHHDRYGAEDQVARTTELLSAMLDSLGEAHHRPFSRA